MTLIEEAKLIPTTASPIRDVENTDEFVDFLLAFLEGQISYRQAAIVMKMRNHPGQFTHWVSGAIRRAYQAKKIKIIKL